MNDKVRFSKCIRSVIKQRMQMCNSPFNGCVECARCVFRREGWCAFYRSYFTQVSLNALVKKKSIVLTAQLLMNIPFQSVHFMIYEGGQQMMNPKREYDPKSHLVCGGRSPSVTITIKTNSLQPRRVVLLRQ